MTARLKINTVLLPMCALALVFILRRPDLHFSMDVFSEAFYKNVGAVFIILPAVIAYFVTNEFSKTSQGSSSFGMTSGPMIEETSGNWDRFFKYVRYASIIIIVCVLISVISGKPYCDEYDNCDDHIVISETEHMMNFIRVTMAALVGMVVAFARRG